MRANTAHMDPLPDTQQLDFVSQVREIQERYPLAHASLLNWAKWSRETKGIYPRLEVWSGWSMGLPIEEWAVEGAHGLKAEDTAQRKRSEPLKEVRADPLDEGQSLERQAAELDAVINTPEFPAVLRKVIKAVYVYKRVPSAEHQYPGEAGMTDPNDFLAWYDACLHCLTTREAPEQSTG